MNAVLIPFYSSSLYSSSPSFSTSPLPAGVHVLQATDSPSTGRVLKAIVQMCFDMQEWELLNENILLLTKKRGQLKTVRQLELMSLSFSDVMTIKSSRPKTETGVLVVYMYLCSSVNAYIHVHVSTSDFKVTPTHVIAFNYHCLLAF